MLPGAFSLPAFSPETYYAEQDENLATNTSSSSTTPPQQRSHNEIFDFSSQTDPESEFHAMVHKPIKHWQDIADATAAVDKEWNKLEKGHLPAKEQSEQGAWDLSRVRPKEDVKQEAETWQSGSLWSTTNTLSSKTCRVSRGPSKL